MNSSFVSDPNQDHKKPTVHKNLKNLDTSSLKAWSISQLLDQEVVFSPLGCAHLLGLVWSNCDMYMRTSGLDSLWWQNCMTTSLSDHVVPVSRCTEEESGLTWPDPNRVRDRVREEIWTGHRLWWLHCKVAHEKISTYDPDSCKNLQRTRPVLVSKSLTAVSSGSGPSTWARCCSLMLLLGHCPCKQEASLRFIDRLMFYSSPGGKSSCQLSIKSNNFHDSLGSLWPQGPC